MKDKILDALNIRYSDFRFVLKFPEESVLPRQKVSALRGGMGQMLLAQDCIADGDCKKCSFESECPVRHMMYARYEIQPRFGGQGESMGYIIECENLKEHFDAGECLNFHLLLFGKAIIWISQYLQAFYMLGQVGLGKYKAKYQILRVENDQGSCVMKNNHFSLSNLPVPTIRSYAEARLNDLQQDGCQNTLRFLSPVTIKYNGEFLHEFQAEAIIRSLFRRIYSFDCFEGFETELMMWDGELPQIVRQSCKTQYVRRYSGTQDSKMSLQGIVGDVTFDYLPEELLLLLAAGEKLHIGKNTSFGFGKYVIK